jgi:DNA-binding CsgD family transcriptional regulator
MTTATRPRQRPLKPYQRDILWRLSQNHMIDQIARHTDTRTWTVRSRIKSLHHRYGTDTRLALVLTAMAVGDLDPRAVLTTYRPETPGA